MVQTIPQTRPASPNSGPPTFISSAKRSAASIASTGPRFSWPRAFPSPRSVKANGWLLFDQGKMSKSRGNIVRAETVHEVLGADALRYFLLREIPFGQDGNFSFDALVQRYNGDLANGYGNLVSRVVNMVHKYFGGVVPEAGAATQAESALREQRDAHHRRVRTSLRRAEFL